MAAPGDQRALAPPLLARFTGPLELEPVRAGAIARGTVRVENAGAIEWRSRGALGIQLSYHWLDDRGNPIVWDGLRNPLPHPVPPGGSARAELRLRGPMPPGRYRLAVDLVDELRHWFGELGNEPVAQEVEVGPRIERRALAVRLRPGDGRLAEETRRALAAQAEPLVESEDEAEAVAHLAPGCLPAPDWSRRVLDAHAAGYAAVGGSLEPSGGPLARRRAARTLEPWAPGPGRVPGFAHPLLCPSLLRAIEPAWTADVEGLPALTPPVEEPWLFDGRIAMRIAY